VLTCNWKKNNTLTKRRRILHKVIRTLIIEDNWCMRESLKDVLEATEIYKVLGTAVSREEVIGLLSLNSVQLILIDMELPDGDSLLIIKDVRKLSLNAKIVGLCVFMNPTISKEAKTVEIDLLIEKAAPASFLMKELNKLFKQ
jgi:DNA-binding NarL/FixJ family response regulator